ncbi:NUDIX domain-containing protein [Actinomadura litoris]|uniref:NUDIX domain-containing protein n=1 Tax=Actinomadura litoris TaxID=2678616 RepID=UPI001FA7DDA8|nr:NUDIX hydrolase [Actinomadura litoris]
MGQAQAVVAVLRRGGRVLVIRRGPEAQRSGYWAPLSGKVEPGESQADAVAREVHEEVGLRVTPLSKVWESETDDGRFQLHWWVADAETGDVVMDPGEVSDVRWVTPNEFLRMEPVFEGDREFFERLLPDLLRAP